MWRRGSAVLVFSALAVSTACGGESNSDGSSGKGGSSTGGGGTSTGGGGTSTGGTSTGGTSTGGSAGASSGGSGGITGVTGRCGDAVPAGAVEANDPTPYAGTCPTLVAGKNAIQSSGNARAFLLALPKDLKPTEKPPIIFLWHWLGG